MKKIISCVLCCCLILMLVSCRTTKVTVLHNYEPECLNTELDGSLTLRVWGQGRNMKDALQQAKKNALNAVLFTGVTKGLSGYQSRPIVAEVNARERYQSYFNEFFSDGGAYNKYATKADRRWFTTEREKCKSHTLQVQYALTIRVNVPELRQQLIADGVLH